MNALDVANKTSKIGSVIVMTAACIIYSMYSMERLNERIQNMLDCGWTKTAESDTYIRFENEQSIWTINKIDGWSSVIYDKHATVKVTVE